MSKMDTPKQRQVAREELQSMKDDLINEMKTMMKGDTTIEKENVENFKKYVD